MQIGKRGKDREKKMQGACSNPHRDMLIHQTYIGYIRVEVNIYISENLAYSKNK